MMASFEVALEADPQRTGRPALGELATMGCSLPFCRGWALGHLVLEDGFNRQAADADRSAAPANASEQVVFQRGGEVFRAAHDVADRHQVIVATLAKL